MMSDLLLISGSVAGSLVTVVTALFAARAKRRSATRNSLRLQKEDGSVVKIGNLDKTEVDEIVSKFHDRVQSVTK